ncbi:MAG: protein kinase [Myxococcota bacterium]
MTDAPPEVPGYDLIDRAGAGAMGEVWRARHRITTAPVAVKIMPKHPSARVDALMASELAATACLDHPHIVKSVDAGELPDGTARWLALEWCGHGTLERTADWPTLHRALQHMLAGLAHAHARQVLHRDLKPGNVICGAAEVWKLADFGVAHIGPARSRDLVGTPAYLAPEVAARSGRLGPWTDLYSLGCTVWHVLTGAPPFDGDLTALVTAHQVEDLPDFVPVIEAPASVRPWLDRLLAKDPLDRPRSAAEAAGLLDDASWAPRVPNRWSPEPESGRDTRLQDAGIALLPFREPPLRGRNAELDLLWRTMADVIASGHPRVCVLTGPEGIGRTRVAVELARDVHRRGLGVWGHARFGVAGLRPLGELLDAEPTASSLAGWQGGRPAALVLDDLVDAPTGRAIAELVLDHDAPLLWLVTADRVPAALTERLPADLWEELPVGPLTRTDCAELVQQVLSLAPAVYSRLLRQAEGVPGRVTDAVREWVELERLVPGDQGFELAAGIPRSEMFDASQREALELVALCGGSLELDLWTDACERAGIALDWNALRAMEAAGQAWFSRDHASGPRFVLDPGSGLEQLALACLRDRRPRPGAITLLDELPEHDDRRPLLCIAAGRVEEGVDLGCRRADAYRLAGDLGRAQELVEPLLDYVEHDEPRDLARIWRVRNAWLTGCVDLLQPDLALERAKAWRSELPGADPLSRARYWGHIATAYRYRGDRERCIESLERVVAVLERDRGLAHGGRLLQAVSSQLVSLGELEWASELTSEALRRVENTTDEGFARLTLGRIHAFRNDFPAAERELLRALECARDPRSPLLVVSVLSMLGETASRAGDLEAADRYLTEACAVHIVRARGHTVMAEVNRLGNTVRLERWSDVVATADRLEHDPRVRRLALAGAAVLQMSAVASAALKRWDDLHTRLAQLSARFDQHPGLADPDFVAFSEQIVRFAALAPPEVRERAEAVLQRCRERLVSRE